MMRSQTLHVPGARLYHEVRGSGPVLLLIPGGNGDAGFYAPFAKAITDRYTVVTYDRRGFSRSPLTDPVDDIRRLRNDADDAHRLLEALSDRPAFVFGSSSGAIVALELLAVHPDLVASAVVHEPPVVTQLPDGARYLAFFEQIYQEYRNSGMRSALRRFSAEAGGGPPHPGSREFWRMLSLMPRLRVNLKFWFEHELRQYTEFTPPISALEAMPGRLLLAGGRDSRDKFPYHCTTALAERLGRTVVDLPGGHIGYRTHPARFAAELHALLT